MRLQCQAVPIQAVPVSDNGVTSAFHGVSVAWQGVVSWHLMVTAFSLLLSGRFGSATGIKGGVRDIHLRGVPDKVRRSDLGILLVQCSDQFWPGVAPTPCSMASAIAGTAADSCEYSVRRRAVLGYCGQSVLKFPKKSDRRKRRHASSSW